ncbi:Thylakoid lumenal protein [Nymphaea thermarum]|nr:Thylakoid lumenal protein [Nymphaea thermarum]
MATIFSPSAILFSASPKPTPNPPPPKQAILQLPPKYTTISKSSSAIAHTAMTAAAAAAAVSVLISTPVFPSLAEEPSTSYRAYYGTAASAANYGGYGGNSNKKDSAEYVYEVPDGWKERLISKIAKGTNGTDSEFYNPKKKTEKEYLTFLSGFRQLAPRDTVLNNLALSDVDLQDLISTADSVRSEEKKDDKGQVYYVYEIEGTGGHSLISVTCAKNKLYAHFVNAPTPEWNRDKEILMHVHESFRTVGST